MWPAWKEQRGQPLPSQIRSDGSWRDWGRGIWLPNPSVWQWRERPKFMRKCFGYMAGSKGLGMLAGSRGAGKWTAARWRETGICMDAPEQWDQKAGKNRRTEWQMGNSWQDPEVWPFPVTLQIFSNVHKNHKMLSTVLFLVKISERA